MGLTRNQSAMSRYANSGIAPLGRASLRQVPSQGSLEVLTNYTSNQSGRRSHVQSTATMRTLASPMEMMGPGTAEKWYDQSTRIFQKVEEDDDDIPFYEKNKRKKETIDHDEEDAQHCAIC